MRSRRLAWASAACVSALAAVAYAADTAETSAPKCALDGQLLAGRDGCGSRCDLEASVGCIARNLDTQVCESSRLPSGCPLAPNKAGNCAYQCILSTPDSNNATLVFYITPNTTDDSAPNENDIRQSEAFLTSISSMELQSRFQSLTFIGGFPRTTNTRVVSTQVNLTVTSASLRTLTLQNVNMSTGNSPRLRVNQTAPTLASLVINNCLLDAVPTTMSSFKALKTLDLANNNLTTYPIPQSVEGLISLTLRKNQLIEFPAAFPSLKSLDLSDNLLTKIPETVFLSKNLTSLLITGNPLDGATFTEKNYFFLTNLTRLEIDAFEQVADSTWCADVRLLRTFPVCVSDASPYVAIPKSDLPLYIIAPIGATAAVMLVGFSLWYYRRKKRFFGGTSVLETPMAKTPTDGSKSTKRGDFAMLDEYNTTSDGEVDSINGKEAKTTGGKVLAASTSGGSSLWTDEELLRYQLRYEDIQDVEQIGAGAFAVVWLVRYRESRLLASKRLVKDQLTRQKTMTFVAEIKLVAPLDHPSIVQFVGVAWTVESDLQALFEYMPNGDLLAYLQAAPARERRWSREKLQLAVDVVEALVYVHSFTPPLVHRDLKSKNVLLSGSMKAKLSDFGVSRFQSENGTMTAGVGTGKWLAPEVLLGGSDYDFLADIYSLGVVLCEMDTHELPFAELQLPDVAVLQMVVGGNVRPRLSGSCPSVIREVVERCLSFESRHRPSAMEIAYTLRTFAKTVE